MEWRGSAMSATSGAMSFAGQSARHQRLARGGGVRGRADQADHFVDIGDRDGEADLDMGAVARLVEQELGAPADDLLAEIDERLRQSMS